MDPNWRDGEPEAWKKGDHIIAIIAKSVGIAAALVGAAWAITAIAFRYL